jgi:hypothetical protein
MIEIDKNPGQSEPAALIDFAAEVQSLDPSRPVAQLAFEHIHDRPDASEPAPNVRHFIDDYFRSHSLGEDGFPGPDIMVDLFAGMAEHARSLARQHPANIFELDRRMRMWSNALIETNGFDKDTSLAINEGVFAIDAEWKKVNRQTIERVARMARLGRLSSLHV